MNNVLVSLNPSRKSANNLKFVSKKPTDFTPYEMERLARKGMVYMHRFDCKEDLANYLPHKRKQLKMLRKIRAPKSVIDATIRCIKTFSRRYRKLLTWSCKRATQEFTDALFWATVVDITAHEAAKAKTAV